MSEYQDEAFIRLQDINRYLQWKSDAWRNVAIMLVEAIKSNVPSNIEKSITRFEEVKNRFPYGEI